MFKKILYSRGTKKIYDLIKDYPGISIFINHFANRASSKYLETTKENLNKISPSFCTAKWLQSTIHLEIGETHSCHHPVRHKIDVNEVALHPNRLHNTKTKENARRDMVTGKFTEECSYCWRVEKNGDFSDRLYKSSEDWADTNLSELTTEEKIRNVTPTYLEISFSSDCNLRCAYCFPDISSSIRNEINKHGPYPTTDQFGNNHYQKSTIDLSESFWKWWEEDLQDELQVLRITGGEPLLSKDTFKLFKKLKMEDKKYKFELSLNSNLMVSNDVVESTLLDAKEILDAKKIKGFNLYASIDTWGAHAEFLRFGLNIDKFSKNVETCLKNFPGLKLTFLITYQALAIFNFNQLLEYILDLRKRYPDCQIKAGISKLTYPKFLSVFTLDKSFLPHIQSNLEFMKSRRLSKDYPYGFTNFEIQHLERIYNEFIKTGVNTEISNLRIFINEYERRKDVNFEKYFNNAPELVKLIKQ